MYYYVIDKATKTYMTQSEHVFTSDKMGAIMFFITNDQLEEAKAHFAKKGLVLKGVK